MAAWNLPSAMAQAGAQPHATRAVQVFTELEESLLQAIRSHDEAALQALVDDEFEMIVAQDADTPIPREDWMARLRKPPAGAFTVQQLSVREIGVVAVASFVLRPKAPSATPVFVVDTWQRDDRGWHLTQRHAAPVAGSRAAIPGDSGKKGMPKQM
jgi:hypothetical protein